MAFFYWHKLKRKKKSLSSILREGFWSSFLPSPPREPDSANHANAVGVITGYYTPNRRYNRIVRLSRDHVWVKVNL